MITRRKFLGSLSAVPALAALPSISRQGSALADAAYPAASRRATHRALHSLPPGTVKPGGWLSLYLDKQAKGLALHLPEVSWPFTGAFWAGEEKAPSWWPWEQRGYWIDGALRCALVTGDQRLLQVAQVPVDYTLDHPFSDGYLGPALMKDGKESDPKLDNFRWPNAVFFRTLMAKAEATKDPGIAAAIRRHYLSDRAAYGGPSRDVTSQAVSMKMKIGEVARKAGVCTSAIRFYEKAGVWPSLNSPKGRVHNAENKLLFNGFKRAAPASARWRRLAQKKYDELDAQIARLKNVRRF